MRPFKSAVLACAFLATASAQSIEPPIRAARLAALDKQ